MGEIICKKCHYMNSHLIFHFGNGLCEACQQELGTYCKECKSLVCDSCHLWEHVENE
jgi:hypothetical protein